MKILFRLLIVLAVIVGVALATLIFWGGSVIKQGVNAIGPQVLGVPVSLEGARFQPLKGHVHLSGLFIGNPEGFQTESLFRMQTLEVDLNIKSLLSDEIIIERILIDAPEITYEVGVRRTNIGALLKGLEGDAPAEQPEAPPLDTPEGKPGKSVVIRELVLADAKASVSAPGMAGRAVPVQLSTIVLNDLGGEGQSIRQILTEVMKALAGALGNAVAGAGDLLGDGLKSALEGAGALGGMATDGVRAVTGSVGDATRGARDRIRGSGRDTDDAPTLPETPDIETPSEEAEEKLQDLSEKADQKVREGAGRLRGALGDLRGTAEKSDP